ncbi:MAG: type 1 glutamine amidotransferase domain-containing protein [Gammaproteobacteria bacterium]|nr:type 1 glutamine amidotransferase domain-containing protein [Gammaproteobacteria bacterium]
MADILIVLTSQAVFGDSDKPTGFWLEELATPYYTLLEAGHRLTLCSPLGGLAPVDPASCDDQQMTSNCQRFLQDAEAMQRLATTLPLSDIDPGDHDAVFYPGGHGPLWDLREHAHSIHIIESMHAAGKPVAAVCHGPAVLLNAGAEDGRPLTAGRRVTAFSNSEEQAVGLADQVPYLLEDALTHQGAVFCKAADWSDHCVVDGHLITGQNPASSGSVARALLQLL